MVTVGQRRQVRNVEENVTDFAVNVEGCVTSGGVSRWTRVAEESVHRQLLSLPLYCSLAFVHEILLYISLILVMLVWGLRVLGSEMTVVMVAMSTNYSCPCYPMTPPTTPLLHLGHL